MKEEKENRIIREVFEKLTDGIIFVGTIGIVLFVGIAVSSFLFEMWLPALIAFPFLYVLYRWLGIVLTGIIVFGVILIALLAPILFS